MGPISKVRLRNRQNCMKANALRLKEKEKCTLCFKQVKNGKYLKENGTNASIESLFSRQQRHANKRKSLLSKELSIMFLVNRLLEIPLDECKKYLEKYGNPSDWINLCYSCCAKVENAEEISSQIHQLQSDLDDLKRTFVAQMTVTIEGEETNEKEEQLKSQKQNAGYDIRQYLQTSFGIKMEFEDIEVDYDGLAASEKSLLPDNFYADFPCKEEDENVDSECESSGKYIFSDAKADQNDEIELDSSVLDSKDETIEENEDISDKHEDFTAIETGIETRPKHIAATSTPLLLPVWNPELNQQKNVMIIKSTKPGFADKNFIVISTPQSTQPQKSQPKHALPTSRPLTFEDLRSHHLQPKPALPTTSSEIPFEDIQVLPSQKSQLKSKPVVYPPSRKLTFEDIQILQSQQSQKIPKPASITASGLSTYEDFQAGQPEQPQPKYSFLGPSSHQSDNDYLKIRSTCSRCSENFSSRDELITHIETSHDDCLYCKTCTRVVATALSLENHIRKFHHPSTISVCVECNESIPRSEDFNEHMSESPACKAKAVQCSECSKFFSSEESLNLHVKVAHIEHPLPRYRCSHCNERFNTKPSFLLHTASKHSGEKPYKCDRCDKIFAIKAALTTHTKVHLIKEPDGKKFPCKVCSRVFFNKSHLRRHEKLHGDESPYLCSVCGKSYKVGSQLTTHMWSHDPDRYEKYSLYKYGKGKLHLKNKSDGEDEKKSSNDEGSQNREVTGTGQDSDKEIGKEGKIDDS